MFSGTISVAMGQSRNTVPIKIFNTTSGIGKNVLQLWIKPITIKFQVKISLHNVPGFEAQ